MICSALPDFRHAGGMKSKTVEPDSHSAPESSDRGDVPGWVLITLMTAGLVVVVWAMAGPALGDVFNNAIDRVLTI